MRVRISLSQTWYARSFYRLPAALRLPTSHQELGNYTSRLILSFLRFLARWPGWYGIAVLPCFSASAIIRRHSLWSPLTGHLCRILAVLPLRLSHAHARLRPRKHFKRFHQSRQVGRIPTRSFQRPFSFPCEPRRTVSHCPGATRHLVQTAGLEPAHTSRRGALPTELRLHIPGIRRGQEERKDGWNEDTDITPHPHSDTYFSVLAPNRGQRPIFFAIL